MTQSILTQRTGSLYGQQGEYLMQHDGILNELLIVYAVAAVVVFTFNRLRAPKPRRASSAESSSAHTDWA